MAGALAFAAEVADKRPLPLVRNLKAEHPNADGYFPVRAQHGEGDVAELPGAAQVRRGVRPL